MERGHLCPHAVVTDHPSRPTEGPNADRQLGTSKGQTQKAYPDWSGGPTFPGMFLFFSAPLALPHHTKRVHTLFKPNTVNPKNGPNRSIG